jgi:molybdenum cofactor cytidylyltransferase
MLKKGANKMIWAMILAAGESIRMGKPKLLLPFGKKTIIETIIDKVISSKADKILVVLGSNREKIEEKIKKYPLEITVNPDFKRGMLSSVQRGFKALPDNTRAVLVLLGDQPTISTAILDKIIDAYQSAKKGIVLPVYKKERGHPVLIDLKYKGEVESLSHEIGLRGLVYSHPEDIMEVNVKTASILKDIDYLEDYQKELKRSTDENTPQK